MAMPDKDSYTMQDILDDPARKADGLIVAQNTKDFYEGHIAAGFSKQQAFELTKMAMLGWSIKPFALNFLPDGSMELGDGMPDGN